MPSWECAGSDDCRPEQYAERNTYLVAENEFFRGIKRINDTGEYSDLTILCGTRRFAVHKAIVCPKSDFFMNAVKDWKEGAAGIIELKEVDEEVVEKLVDYFYNFQYTDGIHTSGYYPDGEWDTDFECPGSFPWQEDEGENGRPEPLYMHALRLAISMRVAADKWFVKGLKEYALIKFNSALEQEAIHKWTAEDLIEIIISVYQNTRAGDKFRSSIREYSHSVAHELAPHPGFLRLVTDAPEFATEMLRDFSSKASSLPCHNEDCGHKRKVALTVEDCKHCSFPSFTNFVSEPLEGRWDSDRWIGFKEELFNKAENPWYTRVLNFLFAKPAREEW